eukprot:403374720
MNNFAQQMTLTLSSTQNQESLKHNPQTPLQKLQTIQNPTHFRNNSQRIQKQHNKQRFQSDSLPSDYQSVNNLEQENEKELQMMIDQQLAMRTQKLLQYKDLHNMTNASYTQSQIMMQNQNQNTQKSKNPFKNSISTDYQDSQFDIKNNHESRGNLQNVKLKSIDANSQYNVDNLMNSSMIVDLSKQPELQHQFDLTKYINSDRIFPSNITMKQKQIKQDQDFTQNNSRNLSINATNKTKFQTLQTQKLSSQKPQDKLWFQGETIPRVKVKDNLDHNEGILQTIKYFHDHESLQKHRKSQLSDEKIEQLNKLAMKSYIEQIPDGIINKLQHSDFMQSHSNDNDQSLTKNQVKRSKNLSLDVGRVNHTVIDKSQSVKVSGMRNRSTFFNQKVQIEKFNDQLHISPRVQNSNRFDDLSQNISDEVIDPRMLSPSDKNFYFVNKQDISQFQSFQLNLVKPFERSKLKVFLATSDRNHSDQQAIENFKKKFLSPSAYSTQIPHSTTHKRVVDLKRDLQEHRITKPHSQTWRKQSKNLKPLYKRPDQVQSLNQTMKDIKREHSKIQNFEMLELSRNQQQPQPFSQTLQNHSTFMTEGSSSYVPNLPTLTDQNQYQTQIGYYKTLNTINEKLFKKKRIKSLIENRRQSQQDKDKNSENAIDSLLERQNIEQSILKMTQDFEQDLKDIEKNVRFKVEKLKNPQQIDADLFEKIKQIKHYQGFTQQPQNPLTLNQESTKPKQSYRSLNYGDKLVIYGLLDKEESEDLKAIKEVIKQRQAQQFQDKLKGGFMKFLLDKNRSGNQQSSPGQVISGALGINLAQGFKKQQTLTQAGWSENQNDNQQQILESNSLKSGDGKFSLLKALGGFGKNQSPQVNEKIEMFNSNAN